MRKEAEAARLEALALDKELQINLLLGKLRLDPSEDPGLPPLVETFQEGPNRPNNNNHQRSNSNPKHKPPKQWYKDHHRARQEANRQHLKVNRRQEAHQEANRRQEGHQEANHSHHRQGARQGANLNQQHNKRHHKRPMGR